MSKVGLSWVNDTIVGPFVEALNLNKITGAVEDANTFYNAGGTADELLISTANGNYKYVDNVIIQFKATASNTGAATVNVDSEGVKDLRDTDGLAIDAEFIIVGKYYTFVYDTGTGFFFNAPSGGKTIKSIQSGVTSISTSSVSVTITSIVPANSVIIIDYAFTSSTSEESRQINVGAKILNATTIEFFGQAPNKSISWRVIEFNGVKSKQTGELAKSYSTSEATQATTSVATSKSLLITSHSSGTTGIAGAGGALLRSRIISSTSIGFLLIPGNGLTTQNDTIYWQLIEFN